MKKVHIKSAVPLYIAAAVWVVAGLISLAAPGLLLKLPGFLIVAALSVGGYFVGQKLFPGRDVVMEDRITTGDAEVDREIAAARQKLENLRRANDAIPDPEISANLDRMYASGQQIFKEIGRDPRKVSLVRRFMNYYLPTSEKLMEQYQLLMNAGNKGENIKSAMGKIESSLGTVATAFEKCADGLYADEEMDIDAEIQVMKMKLAGDSLLQEEGVTLERPAAKPAAAQPAEEEKTTKDGIKLTLGGH